MKKFWNDLPLYGKVILLAIIAFIIYKAYRMYQVWIESANYNAAVNQSNTAITQLAAQGIKPSYAQAQFTTWANTIQQAMEGCGASFTETLKPVFEGLKNEADIYALIAAYDVRTIDKCGLFTGDFTGDLSATLAYKFSGVEGMVVSGSISDINNILKQKGISYTF